MKKAILFFLLLSISTISFAQKAKSLSDKKMTYGINIGASHFYLSSKDPFLNTNQVIISNGSGFRLGIIANYQISKICSISPKAELAINESGVRFTDENGAVVRYGIAPISVDLMAHLVFKKGEGKFKPYFYLGPDFKIPLASGEIDATIYPQKTDFSVDFGIGLEKAFTRFNFIPELRYSYGSFDLEYYKETKRMSIHSLSLLFSFSG